MSISKRKADGKFVVEVPVNYEVYGSVELTFDSLEDMFEKLEDHFFVEGMDLPSYTEYIDGSFEINWDHLEYLVEEFKKKENKEE